MEHWIHDLPASGHVCAAAGPPAGLLLQWHLTDRCNLRCAHCYQESYGGGELTFDEWLEVVAQFRDLLAGWRGRAAGRRVRGQVTVTGGEPFVHPRFLDLLDRFAAHGDEFTFAILTNGSLIDEVMARRLRGLGPSFVQVSIEGSAATHDRIRGAGSFAAAVAALRHLRQAGVRTLVSFTAHEGNYREFPEVARLGRRLGVDRVWADRLIPHGSGAGLGLSPMTPEETREFMELMAQAQAEAKRAWFDRTEIAMHRALQFLLAGGPPYQCTAGDTLLTLLPKGDVLPCRRLPVVVGNVRRTTLREVYEGSALLRELRDRNRVSEGCEHCAYVRLCRGGLRCLAYAVTGSPFQADPGCWIAHREPGPARRAEEPDRRCGLGLFLDPHERPSLEALQPCLPGLMNERVEQCLERLK